MTTDIDELIAKVRKMEENCELVLSNAQLTWLEDILERAEKYTPRLSSNALKFLQQCADGFYSPT